MPDYPKRQTKKYLPGLGTEHVVTLEGVGHCLITATITVDTVITNANLVGLPPNTQGVPSNVIIHSLGTTPASVIVFPTGNAAGTKELPMNVQLVTMDHSAVYLRAFTHTTLGQRGAAIQLHVIR